MVAIVEVDDQQVRQHFAHSYLLLLGVRQATRAGVCTHQGVYGTIKASTEAGRFIEPRDAVARLLEEFPVCLWLFGHTHREPHGDGDVFRSRGTTFLNVAAVNHAYGRKASQAFVLELRSGAAEILARLRAHDAGRFADRHLVRIATPYPLSLPAEHRPPAAPWAWRPF